MISKVIKHWAYGLVSAIITGSTTAGFSFLGVAGADSLGASTPQLNLKQLGIILLSGGIVGSLSYLKQSPLPPDIIENETKTP